MQKFVLALMLLMAMAKSLSAQTVATFENQSLPTADTYYVNYNNPMSDVGFTDGLAYFSCFYDTSYGGFWSSGFAYTNKTDSVTQGYTNQYSAITGIGYGGSHKYVTATTNLSTIKVHLSGMAKGKPVQGFYVTNNTYTYYAIRNGYYNAKKFGGTSGNDPDWFKLSIRAYYQGSLSADSVDFYLADYRSANKYIVKNWQWVNLMPLGNADSLAFTLYSSDTAGGFGMNTPAFFCMDNFTTDETAAVEQIPQTPLAKVYPLPAHDRLIIETSQSNLQEAFLFNMSGQLINTYTINGLKTNIPIANLLPATYILQLKGQAINTNIRFVKQ